MLVMITGASAGIGMACAEIFAEKGHDLFLLARREDRLQELAQRFKNVRVHTAVLDVQDVDAIQALAKKEAALFGKVDVLVNNAGLALGMVPFQETSPEQWNTVIDTNIKGLLAVTHALLPHFLARNQGHIVNMGSIAGHVGYPKGNIYCATKFAVHGFTQALRHDLLGTKVRVTEISPGMVNTEFSLVRFGDQKKADSVYAGMTPLTARDVAEAVYWSVERPAHVNVQEIVLYPTDQASPTAIHRKD